MTLSVSNENLPQVVITPKRGGDAAGTVGRTLPDEVLSRAPTLGKSAEDEGGSGFWGEDGFTFGDIIDLVNPLQHIPIVSTIYRAVTGDEIGVGPRLLGGAVLGGVVGFGAAAVNAAIEHGTGKDAGEHLLAAAGIGDAGEAAPAGASAPTLLSSADPVGRMMAEAPETAHAAAQAAQEKADEAPVPIALISGEAGPDPRAVYALGGLETATRRYQQAQMADRMQNTALHMDVKG